MRQQLSDHPEWLDGLTFTSSRLTAEKGPAPYEHFRSAYEKRFGTRPATFGAMISLKDYPLRSVPEGGFGRARRYNQD